MKRFLQIVLVIFALTVGFLYGYLRNWGNWYNDALSASTFLRLDSTSPTQKSFFLEFNLPGSYRLVSIRPADPSFNPLTPGSFNAELVLELLDHSGRSLETKIVGPNSEYWQSPISQGVNAGKLRIKVLKSIPEGVELDVGIIGAD